MHRAISIVVMGMAAACVPGMPATAGVPVDWRQGSNEAPACDITGEWSSEGEGASWKSTITQTGDKVVEIQEYGGATFQYDGIVSGRTVSGTWRGAGMWGRYESTLSDDCRSYAGHWGNNADAMGHAVHGRGPGKILVAATHPPPPASTGASPPSAPPPTAIASQPATTAPQPAWITTSPQPTGYALVIGVEHYRDVPAATGARGDAESFAALLARTMGLRPERVHLAVDDHATKTDILGQLDWLAQNVTGGDRIYFFFSGHGAPNASDQSSYLLPYDGNPQNVAQSALPLSVVMTRLGQTKAHDVLALVDSCFSGAGGRSVLPPGARPLMRVKDPTPAAQMGLFTASGGDEISGPAHGESGGAFTKYVLQALGTGRADENGDHQVSLDELQRWVGPRVAQDAMQDGRSQHPHLEMGAGAAQPADFIVEYGVQAQ